MYYEVKTKCGHVGKKNYIVITFPIKAESAKEAARTARLMPRVKHNYKDAILDVTKITCKKYKELIIKNQNDPYLQCKNKQDQKAIENFCDRIVCKEQEDIEEHIYIWKNKKAIRNAKKYFKFYEIYNDYKECEYAY